MAHQRDRLANAGQEGFGFIEEHLGHQSRRPRRAACVQDNPHQYHYHQLYYNQGLRVPTVQETVVVSYGASMYRVSRACAVIEAAITTNQEVQFHEGKYICQRPQVPRVKERVITSDEAAKMYGGVAIVDYRVRKPLTRT